MKIIWHSLGRALERQTMASILIIGFLVIFIPLVSLVTWYGISRINDSLQQNTKANLATIANQVSLEIERVLQRPYQDITTLAINPVVSSDKASAEDKLVEMQTIQDYYRIFWDITLIDPAGNVITSTTYRYRGDWTGKEWFQEAAQGKVSVSQPYMMLTPRRVVMAYAAPVRNSGGKVTSIIVGQMSMTTIWDIIDSTILGETGYIRIIDENSCTIGYPSAQREDALFSKFEHLDEPLLPEPNTIRLFTYNDQGVRTVAAGAAPRISSYTGGHNWYVIVSQSASEAFALTKETMKGILVGLFGGLLFVIVISAFMIQRATRPLHALSIGAEKIGAGDLTYRVPVSGPAEVSRLAVSFNDMASNLERTESFRAEHGLLRKLQAVGIALAGTLSPDEVMQVIANSIVDILGSDTVWVLLADEDSTYLETKKYTKSAKGHMPVAKQMPYDPTTKMRIDLTRSDSFLAKAFAESKPLFLDDVSYIEDLADSDPFLEIMILKNGMTSVNLVPLTLVERNIGILAFGKAVGGTLSDAEKRIVLVLAHQATISLERARMHVREQETAIELERLGELKSRLLHILSHELRTPLTSLKTSTSLLQESEIRLEGDEVTQRLVGTILRTTERLISVASDIYLMADLLTGSMKIERKYTSCARMVESATEMVSLLLNKNRQALNVSIMPSISTIWGDRRHLEQVLVNLLTNASNYSPEESRIDVIVHDEKSEVVFEIKDQGIGISANDQRYIFDGFYQADSEIVRRAGGKGLGLLFAKTVVELHGGSIWVKSKLGEGSSFFFSIPKRS